MNIQPSLLYIWQRQAFRTFRAVALSGPPADGPSRREKELAAENALLKERLGRKDEVIAEISA